MKKLFAILSAAFAICACTDKPQELTVVTYNVGAFIKYMDNSMPVVVSLMKEAGAYGIGAAASHDFN